MKRVLIDFSKLREADLLALGKAVAKSLDGNAYFPNPTVAIVDLNKLLEDFTIAITNAKYGTRNDIAIKNTLQQQLVDALRELAMYVNTVSKGNLDKLTSTAFPLTKDREKVYITAPVIKSVLQGLDAGSMIVKIGAVRGAKSYIYLCAVDNGDGKLDWQSFPDSKSKFEYTGLEEGKKYWFKVVAVGSNNQAVSSAEVAQYVMQRNIANAA